MLRCDVQEFYFNKANSELNSAAKVPPAPIQWRIAMAKEKTLQDLFHDTLKDIYFAEKKILVALPKMAKAAHSEELRAAFEKHESQTEGHVDRLEKVFAAIDETPRGKTCDAILGIIDLESICHRTRLDPSGTF